MILTAKSMPTRMPSKALVNSVQDLPQSVQRNRVAPLLWDPFFLNDSCLHDEITIAETF
jgi:hypothetical protein